MNIHVEKSNMDNLTHNMLKGHSSKSETTWIKTEPGVDNMGESLPCPVDLGNDRMVGFSHIKCKNEDDQGESDKNKYKHYEDEGSPVAGNVECGGREGNFQHKYLGMTDDGVGDKVEMETDESVPGCRDKSSLYP